MSKPFTLHSNNGSLCFREGRIDCGADYPRLIEWDDSPDGPRTFLLHDATRGEYREEHCFLLTIGEVRQRPSHDPPRKR